MERLQGRVRLGLVLIALAHFTPVTAVPNYDFMAGGAGCAPLTLVTSPPATVRLY